MATLRLGLAVRRSDIGLFVITLSLLLVGLGALFSVSLNATTGGRDLVLRQALIAIGGLIAALILIRMDFRILGGLHWVIYGIGLASLLAVLIAGQTIRGTTGWFVVGPLQLQPVEFVKVIMAIVLAKVMSDDLGNVRRWSFIFRSGAVIAAPVALTMAQPDFGSAIVLLGMWAVMIMLAPVPRYRLLLLLGAAIVVGVVAWTTVLRPYQQERVLTFLNPTRDTLGAGYNVRQALAAIGSGGWLGRGLGLGPQSQLNFLPERQTDFIFASISEELGFLGGGTVIILFGLFFFRLVRLMIRVADPYAGLLVLGLGSVFLIHAVVNIGMNLGVLPVTGIPLPFVSYGGSALLANCLMLGVIQSVAARTGNRPRD